MQLRSESGTASLCPVIRSFCRPNLLNYQYQQSSRWVTLVLQHLKYFWGTDLQGKYMLFKKLAIKSVVFFYQLPLDQHNNKKILFWTNLSLSLAGSCFEQNPSCLYQEVCLIREWGSCQKHERDLARTKCKKSVVEGKKGQCLLIYSVWSFVFTGVNLAFTTQLRAELGARGFPVRFEFTISRWGSRIGASGEQLHTWVTSDTHHLIKETCLVRSPCQGPASLGEAAGLKGFVRLPRPCPGPATLPGHSPQAGSGVWRPAPASRSLGGIACPVDLRGVSLVFPQKLSINRQPVFQTGDSLYCGFWWFTRLPLFLSYFCCVNRSAAVASKGHLITMQSFIQNE